MSTQKNLKNWELQNNSLKERIQFLMTEEELQKPYSFATRVGLSKGTFTGIWVQGRKSLHQQTIDKISASTGVNAGWLATGVGEPFPDSSDNAQITSQQAQTPALPPQHNTIQKQGLTLSTSINLDKLKEVFETTEEILRTQNRTMPALARGEFTVMLYKMFIDETAEPFNAELLQHSTYAVEDMLEKQRLTMSLEKKTLLIVAIYTMYIDTPAGVQQLLQTAGVLLRRIA